MTFTEYVNALTAKHGTDFNGDDDPIVQKHLEVMRLLGMVHDYWFNRFFDSDSIERLDDKIEVMTALIEGKCPKDIPLYYDIIFELLPPEGQIVD
jgi:hypothetical protein